MDELKKREKKWRRAQGAGFLFPGLLALAIVGLVVFFCTPLSELPIRSEKVTRAMESFGSPVTDSTEENREKWDLTDSIARSHSVETDGLRIDFFEAANEPGCSLIEVKLYTEMDKRWRIPDHIAHYSEHNYKLYGLGRNGNYMLYVKWSDRILYLEWSMPNTPAVVEFMKDLNLYTRQVKEWE